MLFIKYEYPINEKKDDVLDWLEGDLQSEKIESFYNGKIEVVFRSERSGDVIKVFHTVHIIDGETFPSDDSFSFEVQRVTDTKSLIIGKYHDASSHIQKLYYFYLVRLGGVFQANFKQSAIIQLQEIQAQITKESGVHLGWTEWKVDEKSGRKSRSYGTIPNDPPIVPDMRDINKRVFNLMISESPVNVESESVKDKIVAKPRKKKKSLVPNKLAFKRKWALLYEFYDKHCGLEKKNGMQFRVFCEMYDGYDMPKWIPQDNETLQNIIDAGLAGEIPKYDSIK